MDFRIVTYLLQYLRSLDSDINRNSDNSSKNAVNTSPETMTTKRYIDIMIIDHSFHDRHSTQV